VEARSRRKKIYLGVGIVSMGDLWGKSRGHRGSSFPASNNAWNKGKHNPQILALVVIGRHGEISVRKEH
jgi:hypothetical protein